MLFEVFTNYLTSEDFNTIKTQSMATPLIVSERTSPNFSFRFRRGEASPDILDFDIVSSFVSCYTPGDFLSPHRDGCKGDKAFILYLNDVPVEDGGSLVIDGVHRIQPRENMLVVMDTGILHEVLPMIRGERWAVAGWFRLVQQ